MPNTSASTLSAYGGVNFAWSDELPPGTGLTTWSAFPEDTPYFGEPLAGHPPQPYMINYRVDDLDALLRNLAAQGVWIDPHRETFKYGKFAWIRDLDGHRIELWQPSPLAEK